MNVHAIPIAAAWLPVLLTLGLVIGGACVALTCEPGPVVVLTISE